MAVQDSLPKAYSPSHQGKKNCNGKFNAVPTGDWRYPFYPWTGDDNYPSEACPIRRHDYIQCTDLKWTGGMLSVKGRIWDAKKSFDIPHPSKENYRLRYICLEGPDAEVYVRGKLRNESVINLPDYWKDLVYTESISVSLTPIGKWQELYVEKIQWGTQILIKNNSGSEINCDYVVFGERKDTTKNIPEYLGLTPNDYPGDNKEYNINSI